MRFMKSFIIAVLASIVGAQALAENAGVTARSLNLVDVRAAVPHRTSSGGAAAASLGGAKCGTGSGDQTAAIQDAIYEAEQRYIDDGIHGAEVYIPADCTLVMSGSVGLVVSKSNIYIRGASMRSSMIRFNPSADNISFLTVGSASAATYWGGVSNLAVVTTLTNGTTTVNGIKLVDVGEYTIDHVQVDLRQVLSGTSRYVRNSKGLWTQGHENVRVNASEFAASAPLYIDANPHTGMEVYTADGFHFTDLILRTSTPTEGQPTGVGCTAGVDCFTLGDGTPAPVMFADATEVYNTTFDGTQTWIGGKYGLYKNQATCPSGSVGSFSANFINVRWEQNYATGPMYYIVGRSSCPVRTVNLIANMSGGGVPMGYFRYVEVLTVTGSANTAYTAGPIMDIGSMKSMVWNGFATHGSAQKPSFSTDYIQQITGQAPIGYNLPWTATWVSQAKAVDGSDYAFTDISDNRPSRDWSAHHWAWAGTLSASAGGNNLVPLPCRSANNVRLCIVRFAFTSSGSGVTYAGEFVIGGASATAKSDASANPDKYCAGNNTYCAKNGVSVVSASDYSKVSAVAGQGVLNCFSDAGGSAVLTNTYCGAYNSANAGYAVIDAEMYYTAP